MSEKKLLPCPFCGGGAIYEIDKKDEIVDKIPALFYNWCKSTFTVENDSPYMEDEKTYEYLKEKTINTWNTRKPIEKIVERLEEKHAELLIARIKTADKSLINEATHIWGQTLLEKQLTMREAIDVVKEEVTE